MSGYSPPGPAVRRIQVGTGLWWSGAEWTVIALHGASVRCRSNREVALVAVEELLAEADFAHGEELPDGDGDTSSAALSPAFPVGLIDAAAPEATKSGSAARSAAVNLLTTGYASGIEESDVDPDPRYGPQNGQTLTVRIARYAEDHGLGVRTVKRWLSVSREFGTESLIDKRQIAARRPFGRCSGEVAEAILGVVASQVQKSSVSDNSLIREVKALVVARHGDDVKLPSDPSLRRYLREARRMYSLHLPKKTQQGNAMRPTRMGAPLVVSRPFEVVEIDSTPLDVLAISEIDGRPMRVVLTIALDVFSRSIVAWRISPADAKAVDAALLLHDMMTPRSWREEWGELARWRYGVPESLVVSGGDDPGPIAGVPVGVASTLSMDNGMIFVSETMKSACVRLGTTLQFARKRRPTDKPHVERAFRTIRTRFAERLPGYTGQSVAHRGSPQQVENRAQLFAKEIEAAFAQWVAVEYQNTPHSGLSFPNSPSTHFTPNEMYDLGIATSGFVPMLSDFSLAISLLPSTARIVRPTGIEVNSIMYDSQDLDPYRNVRSPFGDLDGKWPLRVDDRDLSRIWFWAGDSREPTQGSWIRIPARIRHAVGSFSDVHVAHAKSLLTDPNRPTTRQERVRALEEQMEAMFERVNAFGPANPREAAVFRAGHERIQAASRSIPQAPQNEDDDFAEDSSEDTIDLAEITPFEIAGEQTFDDLYPDEEYA